MKLLNPAVKPAVRGVISDAVNGGIGGGGQLNLNEPSLELLFVFDVYKSQDYLEPASFALDFANDTYAPV